MPKLLLTKIAEVLKSATIISHSNTFLLLMLHKQYPICSHHLRHQRNFHYSVCNCRVNFLAFTQRGCMNYTSFVVHTVSSLIGVRLTFIVEFTHRCTVERALYIITELCTRACNASWNTCERAVHDISAVTIPLLMGSAYSYCPVQVHCGLEVQRQMRLIHSTCSVYAVSDLNAAHCTRTVCCMCAQLITL